MKESILTILKESNQALSIKELNSLLLLTTKEEHQQLLETMKFLEEEFLIYRTHHKRYLHFVNSPLKQGRLIINKKGFGFVAVDNEDDIYIRADNLNKAIHNDLVIIKMISKPGIAKQEGRIVKILKRELNNLIGEVIGRKNKWYLKLDDDRIKLKIVIAPDKLNGAVAGHKVILKVIAELGLNKYKGEVIKILGHKNDPGIDILTILHKYHFDNTFNSDLMLEVEKVPNEISPLDIKGRRDLRHNMIFTIDDADAKDLDDAVSLKRLANGHYLLGIHIADVSYYLSEESLINQEAKQRGTSVYLVDSVVPMLPHQLSNGICSLNEGVDRLTITCEVEIDSRGQVIKYDLYESVINSKKKMTYQKVNQILEHNLNAPGYEPFYQVLSDMQELSDILTRTKEKRGYLDFALDEAKIIVDNNGKPLDIKLRERGVGQKIIEDFMIIANETVAHHINHLNLPFVYRIHEYPEEEKIRSFLKFLTILGYNIKGRPKDLHPKAIQNILNNLKDKKEFKILSSLLLRAMKKAIYAPNNVGHYGLASRCYTHFTAPIRRYPDLIVHRLLRTYIFNQNINNKTVDEWLLKLGPLCEHSSLKEREAIDCEREVMDMKMAEYMLDHIGKEYTGIISSVMKFGLFVELDNLVEGLIHITDIKDDYYLYDETTLSLVGKRTNKRYRIGDIINIKVKSASKEAKSIDFELA